MGPQKETEFRHHRKVNGQMKSKGKARTNTRRTHQQRCREAAPHVLGGQAYHTIADGHQEAEVPLLPIVNARIQVSSGRFTNSSCVSTSMKGPMSDAPTGEACREACSSVTSGNDGSRRSSTGARQPWRPSHHDGPPPSHLPRQVPRLITSCWRP